ncbi:MAG: hypothetical protein H6815_12235 [Phycisphaeraceae bacterium]|nr:hypothetical protein [Phycisphaerales bacterium]MCB9861208.1 hypothetical protein [Phycisphaeraceae bacterium]
MRLYWIRLAGGLGFICAGSGVAYAQTQLPIINPSFEQVSRPLASGELTNGCGGVGVSVGTRASFFAQPQFVNTVEVAGWRTYLPPPQNPTALIYAGVLNSPDVGAGQPYLTGHTGMHVANLHHVAMQQTLPVFIQPNTHYRLSFLAGFGTGETQEGIYVWLLGAPDLSTIVFPSNGEILTQTQGLLPPISSEGQMLPYELEVTTPNVLPTNLQSKYIAIAFIGSDGIPSMNYDDFQLVATRTCGFTDCDGSGALNVFDYICFGNAYAGNDPYADCDGNGILNIFDYICYGNVFAAGCP